MTITAAERKILAVLAEIGGIVTGDVSRQAKAFPNTRSQLASAWTRSHLLILEKSGLVARLDAEKPVCWVRTAEGTRALGLVEVTA